MTGRDRDIERAQRVVRERFGEGRSPSDDLIRERRDEAAREGRGVVEWYAEIAVRFGERMPVQTEGYTERMERFEDSLSAFLGGPFEPSMIGFADRLETYAYVEAQSPEEAAGLALRPFGESAEAVWGPGTDAEVLRVVTSEERDRELERELGG